MLAISIPSIHQLGFLSITPFTTPSPKKSIGVTSGERDGQSVLLKNYTYYWSTKLYIIKIINKIREVTFLKINSIYIKLLSFYLGLITIRGLLNYL